MKRVMVRYKVKAERAAENVRAIEGVFAELVKRQPPGLRYASFKLDDGVSFVHIASIETSDGQNPLLEIGAFKEFAAQVRDRCAEAPVTAELTEVGSYRVFG